MQFNTNPAKKPAYDMQIWYAWYPVMTEKGLVVWLENVLRGYDYAGNAYYHLP